MNINAKAILWSGVFWGLWAVITGAPIAWKLAFAWCSLVALLYLIRRYWAYNLACSVELKAIGGAHEGDFEITYVFANNGLMPIPVCQVSVHLDKELGAFVFPPETLWFSISEIKSLKKRFRCPRRGIYHVGGATVTFWDTLGIGVKIKSFEKQITVEVFPHKYPVESLVISSRDEGGGLRGNWAAEQDYTSIRRLREALPQESVRHVHWKASARTEELQIREYETRKRPGITVIVESDAGRYSDDRNGRVEERCVEVAAGLIDHWIRKGYSVNLLTGTGAALEIKGPEFMEAALRALMVFKPEEKSPAGALMEILHCSKWTGTVLQLVTPSISGPEALSIAGLSGVSTVLYLVGPCDEEYPETLRTVVIPI